MDRMRKTMMILLAALVLCGMGALLPQACSTASAYPPRTDYWNNNAQYPWVGALYNVYLYADLGSVANDGESISVNVLRVSVVTNEVDSTCNVVFTRGANGAVYESTDGADPTEVIVNDYSEMNIYGHLYRVVASY